MKTRKRLLVILSLTLSFVFGGCKDSSQKGEIEERDPDSVVISMDLESEPAAGFDPIFGWAAGEHTHDPLIQSTLLVTKDDLTIGKDLATDYAISPDKKTWTFQIREDVKFTDGTPLTAADVAFTFNKAKEQATQMDLSMLDFVEAPQAGTVIFHLKRPYSAFAYIAAVVGIVPKASYDPAQYGQNPVGSGRYVLKQWNKGEQVILSANPNYYGEVGPIKQITIVFMSEEASYAAAKAGVIDVAYTAPDYTLKPLDGYEIKAFDSVDIRGINLPSIPSGGKTLANVAGESLPAGNDVTANREIRQALSFAIDREALVYEVLHGYGAPAFSESDKEPWANPAMKEVSYDPERSKKIMEEAGWQLNSKGIYEKNGIQAEFDLLYMSSNSVRTGIAMAVAQKAAKVGIKINPKGSSWDEISKLYYETPHVFGAGMHSPAGMISHYYTGKNAASYSNPAVDQSIDQALSASSVEESYPYWQKAYWNGETGVTPLSDAPWVWLVEIDHIYFVRQGLLVIDDKIHPHGYGWTITNNIHQWSWN